MKKQTDITKKQNQRLDKIYEFYKKGNDDDDENKKEDHQTMTKKNGDTGT